MPQINLEFGEKLRAVLNFDFEGELTEEKREKIIRMLMADLVCAIDTHDYKDLGIKLTYPVNVLVWGQGRVKPKDLKRLKYINLCRW